MPSWCALLAKTDKGTRKDTILVSLVSHPVTARLQNSSRVWLVVCAAGVSARSSKCHRNVVRGCLSVITGYGMVFSKRFQPCKGGDVMCIRGLLRSIVAEG